MSSSSINTPPLETWLLPEIGGEHVVAAGRSKDGGGFTSHSSQPQDEVKAKAAKNSPMTRSGLAEIERLAREEAFAIGRAEGYAKGYAEGESRARELGIEQTVEQRNQLTKLIDSITFEVSQQQDSLRSIVTELIIQIATALCQRELELKSSVETIVKQALDALPVGEKHVTIYLHANDLKLLESFSGLLKPGWQLSAESTMAMGGCRVESEHSQIDATVTHRLSAIIEDLFISVVDDKKSADASRPSFVVAPDAPASTENQETSADSDLSLDPGA